MHSMKFSSSVTFLQQSSYFASMFSGSWKESSESEIGIDVPDDNIDIKGKG